MLVQPLSAGTPTARYAATLLVLLADLPSPNIVFPEGDIITDAVGRQASLLPADSILPNVGSVEPPSQTVLPGTQLFYNGLSILALPYFASLQRIDTTHESLGSRSW